MELFPMISIGNVIVCISFLEHLCAASLTPLSPYKNDKKRLTVNGLAILNEIALLHYEICFPFHKNRNAICNVVYEYFFHFPWKMKLRRMYF